MTAGVELPLQFGYMTAGRIVNLNAIHVSLSPIMALMDPSGWITLCSEMSYDYHLPPGGRVSHWGRDFSDRRLIRIGTGRTFDKAVSNARQRIGGLLSDIGDIKHYLFNQLCLKQK